MVLISNLRSPLQTFATTLSDSTVVELCKNGLSTPVTFQNKNDFIIKSISARLNESTNQCNAIRKGLAKIVPEGLLNLMTADELKEAKGGKIRKS